MPLMPSPSVRLHTEEQREEEKKGGAVKCPCDVLSRGVCVGGGGGCVPESVRGAWPYWHSL
jgi:hypothetical protein